MVRGTHLLGIGLTLVGCVFLAAQNLLLRKGTDAGRAYDAILVVMLTNIVVLLPVVLVVYYPHYGLTRPAIGAFVAAGIAGTMLGRAFKYVSIDRIGASRTEPVVMVNALVATILGVLLLGESIAPVHWAAILAIVVGIGLVSWETARENPHDLSPRELALGLVLPVCAAVAYGVEPVFASYGLDQGTPPPVAVLLKTTAALGGFLLYLGWQSALPTVRDVWSTNTRLFVLAGLANTTFILGYYTALRIAPVSVVAPITPTSTLFTVLLAAIFMPSRLEHVTRRLVVAATVVVAGVVVLSATT